MQKLTNAILIAVFHKPDQSGYQKNSKISNKSILNMYYSQYVSLDDTYVRSKRPRFSKIEKARFKQLSGLSGNFDAKRAL